MASSTSRLATAVLIIALTGTTLLGQSSRNMVLQSKIPFPPCTTGDVTALGNYMIIARRWAGFAVVDATDPENPIVNTITPPGYPASSGSYGVGDVQTDGRYIYATDEATGQGVFIYDTVPNPMQPTLVSTLSSTSVFSCHNCWVDGNYLYAQANIIDVSDKSNPRFVGRLTFNYVHDVVVVGGICYLSAWNSGFEIYDVTNPRLPLRLGSRSYPNSTTHNSWPSTDGNYLFTTDEVPVGGAGGFVRVWDISNKSNITQVATYKAGPKSSTVHNVYVAGDLLFVTYYKEGLRVVDIANPANPVEIAHYDTYLPTANGCFGGAYAGCWGAHPWDLTRVFVSDMDSGGYILRFNPIAQTFSARSTTVMPGQSIDLTFSYQNNAPATLGAFGVAILSSINASPVLFPLLAEYQTLAPAQSLTHQFTIPIPLGLPTPLTIGFTGYTGTANQLIVSEQRTVTVTVN